MRMAASIVAILAFNNRISSYLFLQLILQIGIWLFGIEFPPIFKKLGFESLSKEFLNSTKLQ